MLRTLRYTALVTFAGGLCLLAFGIFSVYWGDGDDSDPGPPRAFDLVPPTATRAATPTAEASPTVVASPTPTPFAGNVARMKIPSLGVDAAVEPIGVDAENRMEVPADYRNVGWYAPELTG